MNDRLYVDTEGIKAVAMSINQKREEINSTFTTKILPILGDSEEVLKVANLNYNEIINAFETVFGSLDEKLLGLSEALTKQVVPNYEMSADLVKQIFNSELASELNNAVSIMKQ